MTEKTHERIERVFRELHLLLKEGKFDKHDVQFMWNFFNQMMTAVKNMAVKAEIIKEPTVAEQRKKSFEELGCNCEDCEYHVDAPEEDEEDEDTPCPDTMRDPGVHGDDDE